MNQLIKQYKKESRWVSWKLETRKGKTTKLPYSINGQLASSTNPATWATYDEVKKHSKNVGIIFTPAQDLLGIDIDHCLKDNKIEHEQKQIIQELIAEAETYTEISPSGEGLHLYLKLKEPLKLVSNKKAPFEAYTSGRYFTVTANPYGKERAVRTVTSDEALKILAVIGYPWKTANDAGNDRLVNEKVETSDADVLKLMFKSKNGEAIRTLYDGDISHFKNDASRADSSLCAHLAFWTRKNTGQMERIWLASPLGQREKTQTRAPYRKSTIKDAVEKCKEVYESFADKSEKMIANAGLDLMFIRDSNGKKVFIQNTENMCRILHNHKDFVDRLRYDVFKNVFEYRPNGHYRPLEDNDAITIQKKISVMFPCFARVGKDLIYDAILNTAKEKTYDSAADYIKAIKWDKKARLDSWLNSVYGTPLDDYHKKVASNWIKGLVKRIIEPGCKFDYVLVLEGPQGSRKSTSLGILGGDWHVETTMSTDSKDFFMQFQGKAIIEFSEGETLSRTEVKRMKAIITMQSDKYRPPYERVSQDFPRRCVFAMTTNQEEYLKDETGNRRWLPIRLVLPQANVEWLKENRDQLFAEAYHRVFEEEETIYEFPKEATEEQQAKRRVSDPNAEIIADWYFTVLTDEQREAGITVHQVFSQALGNIYNNKKEMSKWQEMAISDVLKSFLKLEKRQNSRFGIRMTRWYETAPLKLNVDKTTQTAEDIIKEMDNSLLN